MVLMVLRKGWFATALLVAAFTAAPLSAQETSQSILSSAELSELVADHGADLEARRSALRAFLEREDVREAAEAAGLDVGSVEAAVSTLSAEELDRIEPALIEAEAALAGEGLISFAIGVALLVVLVLVIIELV
jgi:hypothetical protein